MSWEMVRLGDVVTLQRGHDLPAVNFVEGQYPVIGSNGIIGYHNEYTTEAPCLTIGRSGSVGRTYFYEGKAWAHNTSLYVKKYQSIDLRFFYHVLNNLNLAQFASYTAVPTLDRNNLTNILIPLPTLDEQRCIATEIDRQLAAVEKAKKAIQTQLDTINAMPSAILRQAFSGHY